MGKLALQRLRFAEQPGATLVGLDALEDEDVLHADIAFGSQVDVQPGTDPTSALDRFGRTAMTSGADGACQYSPEGELRQQAFRTDVVGTTGPGDAFLAGYLAAYAHGLTDAPAALEAGARWAAAMVSVEASTPPAWQGVEGGPELLSTLRSTVSADSAESVVRR